MNDVEVAPLIEAELDVLPRAPARRERSRCRRRAVHDVGDQPQDARHRCRQQCEPADRQPVDDPQHLRLHVVAEADAVVALDIARGRLAVVDHRERVCGDVQALPFADGTFDAVMAMHMLYHVPDIPAAVVEMRRVLRDDGVLYAFTNSARAQWELAELLHRNGCDPSAGGDFDTLRFSNENGAELLRTAFDDVVLHEDTGTRLVVTDPECVVDEIVRNRYIFEPGLRPDVTWDALVHAIRRETAAIVDRDGAFVLTEDHGLFACQ